MLERFVVGALFLCVGCMAKAQALPEMRMTPAEIRASAQDENQIGRASCRERVSTIV